MSDDKIVRTMLCKMMAEATAAEAMEALETLRARFGKAFDEINLMHDTDGRIIIVGLKRQD